MTPLVDGMVYETKGGAEVWIAGTVKENADWCWSVQGNWYERASGRYVGYRRVLLPDNKESGERYTLPDTTLNIARALERSWK